MIVNRNRTRTTKWNLIFHYSTIIYGVITGIVLVPLYLKFIPANVYGYWLATGNILAWLTMIDPGFGAVLQQKIALNYGASNYNRVGQYALGGIIINLGFVVLISLLGIIFGIKFNTWLDITDTETILILKKAFNYALLGTILMLFSYILVSINQGLQSSLGIGLIYMLANLSGIIVSIILLYKGWGVVAIGASLLWRSIIYVVGNLLYMFWRFANEQLKFTFDSSVFKDFTQLSLYNFLGKIGNTLNTQLNSFVSSKILSPIDTTILKFTQASPETSKLFLVRPALALMPSITHLVGEGKTAKVQEVLLRFLNFLIWGSGLALMGFIVFNQAFVTLWVGYSFYGGDLLNVLIVILLFISIFTQSFSSIVFALGNIKNNNIALFIQSLIYVPLVFIGAKNWGLKGLVLAGIIAELSISAWYFPLVFFRKIDVKLQTVKIAIKELLGATLVSILVIFLFKNPTPRWDLFVFNIIASILVYFSLLYVISKGFRVELKTVSKALIWKIKQK